MSLREILESETTTTEEKLEAINDTVKRARANYGNEDAEITMPEVPTINGMMDLSMLTKNDKLAIAEECINRIRMEAHETAKQREGVNISKVIESLLATSPVLSNIEKSSENDYGI
jgi:hypothetical protein